jgi:hypothetical protein
MSHAPVGDDFASWWIDGTRTELTLIGAGAKAALAEIYNAEAAARAFAVDYGAKWPSTASTCARPTP